MAHLWWTVVALAAVADAATLYATHYSGTVNQLTFDGSNLTLASSTKSGNSLPSWLTYDAASKMLYVPDEVYYGTGYLTSFSIGAGGAVAAAGEVAAPPGGIASGLYGGSSGSDFIAVAHYQTSQIVTYKLPLNNGQPLQTIKLTMNGTGPNASRQDAPHPHLVFADPTGGYLLAPDLGADLIRIYAINRTSGLLTECPAAHTPPGSGPRHGAFWPSASSSSGAANISEPSALFIANELANVVSAWGVTYPKAGGCMSLGFKQALSPYQGNATAPKGTKVGELHIKDNFVYITNRNDLTFNPNDSMSQYGIAHDGSLAWINTTSAYGWYPRTFSINQAGTFVAVGDQTSSNVAIVQRDTVTGKLGQLAATLRIATVGHAENEDGLSAVLWAD